MLHISQNDYLLYCSFDLYKNILIAAHIPKSIHIPKFFECDTTGIKMFFKNGVKSRTWNPPKLRKCCYCLDVFWRANNMGHWKRSNYRPNLESVEKLLLLSGNFGSDHRWNLVIALLTCPGGVSSILMEKGHQYALATIFYIQFMNSHSFCASCRIRQWRIIKSWQLPFVQEYLGPVGWPHNR